MPPAPRLILASGSKSRADMLRAAGIGFETAPVAVDEDAVKNGMRTEGAAPHDIADALAELKAGRGATRAPDALVLGADQVLTCEGRLYDKPASRDEARTHLKALRGRAQELISAAVVFEGGVPVWRKIGRARLTMRDFSDAFIDDYLAREDDALLGCVGAYRLEGRGVQLFQRVQGDYFTVLGLPLLDILGFLRSRGIGLT